eukprot:6243187-Ditylum_brightwellii.AAC.1
MIDTTEKSESSVKANTHETRSTEFVDMTDYFLPLASRKNNNLHEGEATLAITKEENQKKLEQLNNKFQMQLAEMKENMEKEMKQMRTDIETNKDKKYQRLWNNPTRW